MTIENVPTYVHQSGVTIVVEGTGAVTSNRRMSRYRYFPRLMPGVGGAEVPGTGVSVAALTGGGFGNLAGRLPMARHHRGYLPVTLELSHPAARVSAV